MDFKRQQGRKDYFFSVKGIITTRRHGTINYLYIVFFCLHVICNCIFNLKQDFGRVFTDVTKRTAYKTESLRAVQLDGVIRKTPDRFVENFEKC
jgi:hypothetical protein